MLKKAKAKARREAQRDSGTDAGDDHAAPRSGDRQGRDLADAVLESSRQIWLAGLGAFARAKGEGVKVFETLVQQGQALESRTRAAAVDTAAAARDAAHAKARSVQARAGGTWDKLEQVFEERVARALTRLGVHSQNDVERLTERVDALSEAVNDLVRARGGATVAGSVGARRRGTSGQGAATRRDLRKATGAATARAAHAGAAKAGSVRRGRKTNASEAGSGAAHSASAAKAASRTHGGAAGAGAAKTAKRSGKRAGRRAGASAAGGDE